MHECAGVFGDQRHCIPLELELTGCYELPGVGVDAGD